MSSIHVTAGAREVSERPHVRKITFSDLWDALEKGIGDFWAMPSHALFLSILYPTVGIVLVVMTSGQDLMPLLYPLLSGFALIGPFAAIGLYEISRRRELGLPVSWQNAFDVLRSPAVHSIVALGIVLMVIFVLWLTTAEAVYRIVLKPTSPQAYLEFLTQVFTTPEGWTLFFVGNFLGFLFTLATFSISVVSFPLLLDHDVGAPTAMKTSIRAVIANPVVMAVWGLTVAVSLLAGIAALLVGLAIVMPVLGHATWHLYRKVVTFEDNRRGPARA